MSSKEAGLIAGIVAIAGLAYLFKEQIKDIIYPYGNDYIPIPHEGSIEEYREQLGDTINNALGEGPEIFVNYVSDLTDAWKEREDMDITDLVTNIAGQTGIEEYREVVKDTITKVQTVVENVVSIPYMGSVEEYRETLVTKVIEPIVSSIEEYRETIDKVIEPIKEVIVEPVKYLYEERYDVR